VPTIRANTLTIHCEQQGSGEPLILIPYLSADCACYAFQVAEFSQHSTCISVDPRGAGETDEPDGVYSTELLAEDVAAFMEAMGIAKARVFGLSLGAAVGMWLAVKYPAKECNQRTLAFLRRAWGVRRPLRTVKRRRRE
jgi:pimeloyl-ACP methyl ester carboxylesterase